MISTRQELESWEALQRLTTLMRYAPIQRVLMRRRLKELRLQRLLEAGVDLRIEEKSAELTTLLHDLVESSEMSSSRASNQKPALVVSTLLLEESFLYLSRQPEESLHFASGAKVGNLALVDQFLPVDLEKATAVFAQACDASLVRLYARLERLGHTVTGVFHIHPGVGESANRPSSIDRDYMKRLAGRSLVFGIWSRDRILRLLIPRKTELRFYGEGCEEIKRNGREILCRLVD